jgi:hypothetical protein
VEQFEEVQEIKATSSNRVNVATAIAVKSQLLVEISTKGRVAGKAPVRRMNRNGLVNRYHTVNALLSKPVLEQTISALVSATPSDSERSRHRFRTRSSAKYRSVVRLHLAYHQSDQNVTNFPELVSASGRRAFKSYWR